MTSIYLVRHGDAVWTPDEMRPLSPAGRVQAEEVAACLAGVALSAVYSSPYARARQTVEPLASGRGLPVEDVSDLRERQLSGGEVPDFRAASQATWDDFSLAHAGGESNAAAQRRGVAAIERLVERHRHSRFVVGSHGTLVALILNAFDRRIGFAFWQRISTPDVYRLEIDNDGVGIIERVWKE